MGESDQIELFEAPEPVNSRRPAAPLLCLGALGSGIAPRIIRFAAEPGVPGAPFILDCEQLRPGKLRARLPGVRAEMEVQDGDSVVCGCPEPDHRAGCPLPGLAERLRRAGWRVGVE